MQLSPAALHALAERDLVAATAETGLPLTPWLVGDGTVGTWRRRDAQVAEHPEDLAWVTGVVCDDATGVVVGRAGCHAAPDERGMGEAGYAVDPRHRRQGRAHAILEHLHARALAEPAVRVLRLSISPDNTASLAVAARLPFTVVGEQWDDEDGLETILELDVSAAR